MIIGSFNIRGLGIAIKNEEIFSFFKKQRLDVCRIQETKIVNFSEEVGK